MRYYFLLWHRYVGLVMVSFLIITGLTGSLLVWYTELDTYFNRDVVRVEIPNSPKEPLSPFLLREIVESQLPDAHVNWMALQTASSDSAARFYLDPVIRLSDGKLVDEVFVDPYRGEIIGGREWGNIGQGMTNFMPFIYRIHDSLAVGGIGSWILGIIAILWTIDCFVGAYLTFPRKQVKRKPSRSWLARWWSAWKIRWLGNRYKLNYDLHTAASLWLWALLGVFALSSVALSLYSQVYKPVLSSVMSFQEIPLKNHLDLSQPATRPPIGWEPGFQAAKGHLEKLAKEHGFTIHRLERLSYNPDNGTMKLMATTSRDINQRFGQSWLYIDALNGQLKGVRYPSGEALGDTFTTWITTLHIAAIWGLPYRIFVSFMGLFIVLLCVTGSVLWWRKKRARKRSERKKLVIF